MKANNQHPSQKNPNQAQLERVVDAGLASYPADPLPTGFVHAVMESVHTEPAKGPAQEPTNELGLAAVLALVSPSALAEFASFAYRELSAVRAQIRRGDVLVAASSALLWCVIAGSFIWTMRIVSDQGSALGNIGQQPWLMPLAVVVGFALVIEVMVIYFYLTQRELT